MKIVTSPPSQKNGESAANKIPGLPLWRKLLYLAVVLSAAFLLGIFSDTSEIRERAIELSRTNLETIPRYIRGRLAKPAALAIDVKFENFQKLAYLRKQALQQGRLSTTDDSYVPAEISAGSQAAKVKLRLKGDIVDHLEGDKWSLRVKVKNGDTLMGMNRFSIQDPKRSGWITEWIFHELLRHEGLIALKYDFVDVSINGKDYGIYALEESFGKELLARNHRPEGPILKFDESTLMDPSRLTRGDYKNEQDIFLTADITSFHTTKTFQDEAQRGLFLAGRQLLNEFRAGKASVRETFDIDKAARVFAVAELLGAHHAVRWKNIRFYMNPVTFKLEPIAYNAYTSKDNIVTFRPAGYVDNGLKTPETADSYFMYLLFTDREFLEKYFMETARLSSPGYIRDFLSSIDDRLVENLDIIFRDYPNLTFNKGRYLENAQQASAFINPKAPVKAYLDPGQGESENRLTIKAGNPTRLPLLLSGLQCESTGTTIQLEGDKLLPPRGDGQGIDYVTIQSEALSDSQIGCMTGIDREGRLQVVSGLSLSYTVLGNPVVRLAPIEAFALYDPQNTPFSKQISGPQLEQYVSSGMLMFNETDREININHGKYKISSNLVLPPGYLVRAGEDVDLDFNNRASLVSYSPLHFEGTAEMPVRLRSSDRNGGGLVVIDADRESLLRYVQFSDLHAASTGKLGLRGAVTFYESDVAIEKCGFSEMHAEDALNIVRSKFNITGTLMTGTESDAVDSDFSTGRIADSTFVNCGNDCIDASGSRITLDKIKMTNVSDKGISAGEGSDIGISDLQISNAALAIVSKDNSVVAGENIMIKDSQIGLAAFQKKPEFGPGTMTLAKLSIDKTRQDWLLEEKSGISIDGKALEPNGNLVKAYLYPDKKH